MLKVDIRKTFDTICWDYLLKLLEAQDFPPVFREWVKECITSPQFSMAINDELTGFFKGEKGLRQGDCISPFLFIMVMESLSKILERASMEGRIELNQNARILGLLTFSSPMTSWYFQMALELRLLGFLK